MRGITLFGVTLLVVGMLANQQGMAGATKATLSTPTIACIDATDSSARARPCYRFRLRGRPGEQPRDDLDRHGAFCVTRRGRAVRASPTRLPAAIDRGMVATAGADGHRPGHLHGQQGAVGAERRRPGQDKHRARRVLERQRGRLVVPVSRSPTG